MNATDTTLADMAREAAKRTGKVMVAFGYK